MTPAAHAAAAIEVLADIFDHHRPATVALAGWGRAHRFAGSRDRAAIGDIVHDTLRRKASLGWRMGADIPRALVLGWLAHVAGHAVEDIARMAKEKYGFGPLSDDEKRALANPRGLDDAPDWVRGDYPRWLDAEMARAFGDAAAQEGAALAKRAALDVRVNALKTTREKATQALAHLAPAPTPFSRWALRFHERGGRLPHIQAEEAFRKGRIAIQDEGSQIAAALTGARPGLQVLDLCAGGGGKTLALAAMMENRGQIFAFDADKTRLAPIHDRLQAAGVRNTQVIAPHHKKRLDALRERMDVVLVDAPCSGSGTWRRKPDAKWRLTEKSLDKRLGEQAALLKQAADYVKPGGRLVYVTCSVLPCENMDQVSAFLAAHDAFALAGWRDQAATLAALPDAPRDAPALQLTPRRHATDGFFIAVMARRP
ncbi:MAG TPA: RsmB/NOP family class I SAM-dependent RNA methyltransferase [Thermopetrobacter sp.]|nr:RsmB/NOP family class I SAM-dependent RNA methyltransferase [Thermopetrobacter sp.]